MTGYWLLFLFPLIGLASPIVLAGRARDIAWLILILASALFVGLRHQVGGDWDNYFFFSQRLIYEPLSMVLDSKDGGYNLINWISAQGGWGIYGTNLFCASVFLGGLAYFCRRQPYPLFAWVISVPYLMIVVGMGYTRQSVVVGLLCCGLILLQKGKGWRVLAVMLLATSFHKSALLFLPLGLTMITRSHLIVVLGLLRKGMVSGPILVSVTFVLVVGGVIFFRSADVFYGEFKAYILSDNWHSEGGMVRSLMNGIPAAFLLLNWRKWRELNGESTLWEVLALVAILAVVVTLFYSTFGDRMGIYLIPLQIYVVSRVPMFIENEALRAGSVMGISTLYGLVLFVWLNYASHAFYWTPYKSLLWL